MGMMGYGMRAPKARKSQTHVWRGWVLACAFVVLFVGTTLAADMKTQLARKFRYPEYDEKNQLKYEIMGDEARSLASGLIEIINLRANVFEDGKMVMQVTAPSCTFDQIKRTANSTSEVCIARSEVVVTGRGFFVNLDERLFEIYNQAKVVLKISRGTLYGEIPK